MNLNLIRRNRETRSRFEEEDTEARLNRGEQKGVRHIEINEIRDLVSEK
ncbi:BnaCnng49730D [Brassica napus]|uniref:BnaCnng49730D protein n=1 Tax=Brassica napus TaxID=3708 RepID=A0A078JHK4_BRANA|nr:BnaCnng49730D [Brassica napus]